jgi:hypothetical protein
MMFSLSFADHLSGILALAATIVALFPAVRGKKGRLTKWGYAVLAVALVAFGWNTYSMHQTRSEQIEDKIIAIDSLLNEMAPAIALYRLHQEIRVAPIRDTNLILRKMTEELEKKFHLHYEKLSNDARKTGQLVVANQNILLIASEMHPRNETEVFGRMVISLQ